MRLGTLGRGRRSGGIDLARATELAIVAVAVGVALGITPARFFPEWSVDAEHNLDRARALLAGGSLVDAWYFYTPLAAALAVPATWLPEGAALVLWAAFKVGLLLTALWLAGASWGRVLVACAFLPLIGDTAIGNVNAVVTATVILATQGVGIPLGIVLATVPKPVIVPFFVWLLVHRRRSALSAILTATVLTVGGAALLGASRYIEYVGSIATAQVYVAEPWNQAVPWLVPLLGILFVLTLRRERDGLLTALALGVAVSPYVGVYTGTVLLAGPFPLVVLALMSLASLGFLPLAAALGTAVTLAVPSALVRGRSSTSDSTLMTPRSVQKGSEAVAE